MIDTAELHARIIGQADDLYRMLFPERAVRGDSQRGWRIGKRGSIALDVREGRLLYVDHESGTGGDFVALWARERSIENGGALKELAGIVQLAPLPAGVALPKPTPRPLRGKKIRASEIPSATDDLLGMLREGREWLWQPNVGRREETWNYAAIADLARWRGWLIDDVAALVSDGIITAPVLWGERSRAAFPVYAPHPMPEGRGDRQRLVGIHARLHDSEAVHRGWRFYPSERMNGTGTPPFPLLLTGSPGLAWAQLVIFTEGEWDALSVALAAGWLGDERSGLPQAVAIVGIRGAASWQKVIDAWAPYWPDGADALLLRDSDKAGEQWAEHFTEALKRQRCGRVRSLKLNEHKDVSDAYRAGQLNRVSLDAMLSQVGWTLARAEAAAPRALSPIK